MLPSTNGFILIASPASSAGRSHADRSQYLCCLFWFNRSCFISLMHLFALSVFTFDVVYKARINIPCKRLGALSRGFFVMLSSGLWSEYTITGRPKVYWCYFSTAKTIASISFSMVVYLDSASLRARLAYSNGCPSWRRAAPRPCPLATHWMVRLLIGFK